jgi:serine/threonine protein kinase/tetratricopeptide (TPR) repeat protein
MDDQRDDMPALPPRPAAPAASVVRKAQVRAALFRKSEPIRVGRFVLLEPLGAGAMGEIYAAYDERLDRKVALKLVRSGSPLTVKADERLLREAQTLAQVSHPNVVQIYEAGTYNGRLFIAMELIRGKTLTTWLRDATQLPRAVRQREILRQFIAAGRGLEAAHAAGVAHRDFKPDNVLVGDDGRVRVVDFGLARALVDPPEPPEPAATLVDPAPGADAPADAAAAEPPRAIAPDVGRGSTAVLRPYAPHDAGDAPFSTGGATVDHVPEPGIPAVPASRTGSSSRDSRSSAPRLKAALQLTETGTVMGTPFFMAPEQMRGAIADRRSDQFSFCVALYHALYDSFPFSGKSLKELRDSMESDEVAFAAGIPVPGVVRQALHRGLSVDPAHRFPTIGDLLAALTPRTRRPRWIASAAGLAAIAIVALLAMRAQSVDPCAAAGAGIEAEWSAARQATIHAAFLHSDLPFAEAAWQGARTRLDDYARRWHGDAGAACRATNVEHTQSAEQLDRRMLCLDRGRRQVAALVNEFGGGAPDTVEHAIEAAGALPDLSACSRAENLLFGVAPPPAAVADQVAKLRDRLAQARTLELLGRYEESLAVARDANTSAERIAYAPLHAEALVQVARALDARSTTDTRNEAQKLYFDGLTIAEAERHDQLIAEVWNKLVMLAVRMDSNMAQAHEWWSQAYAWSRRNASSTLGARDDATSDAELHYMLGEIYFHDSEYAKAADEERRAIAALGPVDNRPLERSHYYDALAKPLSRMGAINEAIRLQERALTIAIEILGAAHPNTRLLQINYGRSLKNHGRRDEARAVLGQALASIAAEHRDSHPDAARIHGFLSELELGDGHLDEAAAHARTSLEIYHRTLPDDHPGIAEADLTLANVEFMRRRFSDALGLYERALEIRVRRLGRSHYQVGLAEGSVAETLLALERYEDAMTHLTEAERIIQSGSAHEDAMEAWLLTLRGEIMLGLQRPAAAVPALECALTLFHDNITDLADRNTHALAMWTLARSLHALGKDRKRVELLAARAYELLATLGPIGAHDRDAVAQFRALLSREALTGSPARPVPE